MCIYNKIGNDFGEEGSKFMSEALKSNSTLTELDMYCNEKIKNVQILVIFILK